jgi:hypothetical protein
MEKRRKRRPLARKRTLQLPTTMAETGVAIRVRGIGIWERLSPRISRIWKEYTLQSLHVPEIPLASSMVVG